MYYVYLLECADGSLYTGITTDLTRRLSEHRAGKGGHYTRGHGAVRMVYAEPHPDRSSASIREAALKRLPRADKQRLAGIR